MIVLASDLLSLVASLEGNNLLHAILGDTQDTPGVEISLKKTKKTAMADALIEMTCVGG